MEFLFQNLIHDLNKFIKRYNNKIDISKYTFIEPIGFTILKSLSLDENTEIINIGKTRNYMNTLFYNSYQRSKSYIPIEVVKTNLLEKATNRITDKIMESFQSLEYKDWIDLKGYVHYMIGEVLTNAIYHSLSPIGAVVSGQAFPNYKKVQICVVDRGIGFKRNLEKRYDVKSEEDAIELALKNGITSPPNLTNPYFSSINHAGYGLYVSKEIIKNTNGELKIISNDGAIHLDKDGKLKKYSLTNSSWKGVIVAFEFYEEAINHSLNEFMNIYVYQDKKEDEEDFFI